MPKHDFFEPSKVTRTITKAPCTWDIYSLNAANEMFYGVFPDKMGQDNYFEEVQSRVMRVTEDLRAIQRELNCAAMEAPTDPELMEALSKLPEMDSLQVLKSALDQMRHFLWFYIQVMTNESEGGEKLRQTLRQKVKEDVAMSAEAALMKKYRAATDAELIRYLSDGKVRKPN